MILSVIRIMKCSCMFSFLAGEGACKWAKSKGISLPDSTMEANEVIFVNPAILSIISNSIFFPYLDFVFHQPWIGYFIILCSVTKLSVELLNLCGYKKNSG